MGSAQVSPDNIHCSYIADTYETFATVRCQVQPATFCEALTSNSNRLVNFDRTSRLKTCTALSRKWG